MSDIAQPALITTLQRLNSTHLARIEGEMEQLARRNPIALVLPCHGPDLDRPAFVHILDELRGAHWLSEIILAMNGAEVESVERARRTLLTLPQKHRIIQVDEHHGSGSGKGANLHAAFARSEAKVIATQDCDVASFRRGDLARLCFSVAHPDLNYRFAKAYYSRATDRLYGRVSRLFLTPLLHAVVRVAGHHPLADFLLSFRYPLAGEIAMTRDLATQLPLAAGWNVELSHLCEVFRRVDPRDVCQVEGSSGYDHKHQPPHTALAVMASEIARELFTQLTVEGLRFARDAMENAYRREAAYALRRSAALARINALPFDFQAENEIVETFAVRLATVEV